MRSPWTALALASYLTLTAARAHAQCAPEGPRPEAALAPTVTLEVSAERLHDRVARGHGIELTLWATWDVSRLWRTRPRVTCALPPSLPHGETP